MTELTERRDTRRVWLWCGWVLLAGGLVALCIPLDLVADAAYRRDGTVLYWLLIAYSYPDGTPAATVVGLAVLALALLAYWISLRLLLRAGRALVALTIVIGISVAFTLMLASVVSGAGPLAFVPVLLAGGLLTAALFLSRGTAVSTSRERAGAPGSSDSPGTPGTPSTPSTPRMSWMSWAMLGGLAPTIVATLLVGTVAPFALLIGERPNSYTHLASAGFQARRYYLALEQTPSDGSLVLLYRCDALDVWCRQTDILGTGSGAGAQQSAGGRLRYDHATRTLTASEGDHLLLTYPAGDLFESP